jgi:IS5 family transposase
LKAGKRLGFSSYEQTTAKKQAKRETFLAEMEAVVPWEALITLIEPHYPKASKKGGRPPYPLATMLRIHLLQQWYSLSDPAMEEALIEVSTMRRFAGIDLISERIPDETTILTFRHLDHGAQLHQEQGTETGSGDPPGQDGQPVVVRNEGAPGCRQELRLDPLSRHHICHRA